MSQVIYQDLIIRNTAIFWNSVSFFKNDDKLKRLAGVFYASCRLEITASLTMFKVNESRFKQCGVTPHFLKTKK